MRRFFSGRSSAISLLTSTKYCLLQMLPMFRGRASGSPTVSICNRKGKEEGARESLSLKCSRYDTVARAISSQITQVI